MGGTQLTSKATDRALLIRWRRDRDITARTTLVERYLPFAQSLARRYMQRGEQLDDLEQIAALALVRAIDRYDLERDVALTTFIMPTVIGELRRHFRDRVWAVHVPRSIHDLATRLGRSSTLLTTSLGRAPTVAELANELQSTEEQVLEALGALASRHAAPLPSGEEPGDGASPLAATDAGFDDVTVRLALGPALESLDDRERRLVELRFVDDLSQSEIASRLGMSQMHVSRLLRRALTRLEDHLHREELGY
ncbi:MAG: polymerase sigma-B factor [Solirubrobacteraceae bacterium]|nr:polymerase sigma-B factor [Solirubrobacteraceae bacterium]